MGAYSYSGVLPWFQVLLSACVAPGCSISLLCCSNSLQKMLLVLQLVNPLLQGLVFSHNGFEVLL